MLGWALTIFSAIAAVAAVALLIEVGYKIAKKRERER